MINLDMIGRLDSARKTLIVGGVGSSPLWQEILTKKNPKKKKIANLKPYTLGISTSDHISFLLNGVPALHFSTGYHSDYRRPTDDANRLNYLGEAYIVNYICGLMAYLDKQDKVEYTKSENLFASAMDTEVKVGLLPDYTFEGPGVRISALNDNSVASDAGMKIGDIVLTINDEELKNLSEYKQLVAKLSEGDKIEVRIIRGEEEIATELQF